MNVLFKAKLSMISNSKQLLSTQKDLYIENSSNVVVLGSIFWFDNSLTHDLIFLALLQSFRENHVHYLFMYLLELQTWTIIQVKGISIFVIFYIKKNVDWMDVLVQNRKTSVNVKVFLKSNSICNLVLYIIQFLL